MASLRTCSPSPALMSPPNCRICSSAIASASACCTRCARKRFRTSPRKSSISECRWRCSILARRQSARAITAAASFSMAWTENPWSRVCSRFMPRLSATRKRNSNRAARFPYEKHRAMKTIAYTSAAVNYLPKVRKLCASIKRLHPEFEVVLALSDKPSAGVDFSAEPIDRVIAVEDLDIPDRTRWSFFHDIVELSTAIKPFVLKKLLAEDGVARVLYFDPDMVLFSRLDDLLAALDAANVVLTPHQT